MRIRETCRAGGVRLESELYMATIIRKKGKPRSNQSGFPRLRPNVAGIDVSSHQLHVCGPAETDDKRRLAVFETTTAGIEECAKWLHSLGVESIAMESTGVYWIAPFEILESHGFEVLLVDTRPLSRVPGRKTDVSDCEWIQSLHRCGLLQGCFRPAEAINRLRSVIRMKAVVNSSQADWQRRMQKCLDQMNVRVHHAVSDINGTTGMAIVRAIVEGQRDPHKLAELRDPRCRKSKDQIAAHLTGHWEEAHLFHLAACLRMFDTLAAELARYEKEISRRLCELTPPEAENKTAPPLPNPGKMKAMRTRGELEKRQELFRMAGADLTTIDGIGVETAEAIVSEYGIDLSKFATERQFVAHLQLAPRMAVSGGKPLPKGRRKTTGTRAGRALRMAATGLRRSPTALGAYYRRISRHKGGNVAVFSTARKLAVLVYRLLRWGHAYVDEGQQAYEARYQASRLRSLVATAEQFGMHLLPNNQLSD